MLDIIMCGVLYVHQVIYLLFSLFSIVNKIYYYFVCEYLRCYSILMIYLSNFLFTKKKLY